MVNLEAYKKLIQMKRVGINTQRYTESEIKRVAISAFELAKKEVVKFAPWKKQM